MIAARLALVIAAVLPHPQHHAQQVKVKKPRWRIALASVYGTGRQGDTSTGTLGCAGKFPRDFRHPPTVLTPGLVGVANKTMPCGAKLTLGYRGRSIRVRVVDRGPYVAGRVFDLTDGAASLIRFPIAVGTVKWRHGWHRR